MRDRLVELLAEQCEVTAVDNGEFIETSVNFVEIADHILADGWIRPPCKIGDTVFHLTSEEVLDVLNCAEIYEGKVFSMAKDEDGVWLYCRYDKGLNYWYAESDIGKSLFLTREEAERALAERREG